MKRRKTVIIIVVQMFLIVVESVAVNPTKIIDCHIIRIDEQIYSMTKAI